MASTAHRCAVAGQAVRKCRTSAIAAMACLALCAVRQLDERIIASLDIHLQGVHGMAKQTVGKAVR